jgi:hypothetical protein
MSINSGFDNYQPSNFTNGNKFDTVKFNQAFDQQKTLGKQQQLVEEQATLNQLNTTISAKRIQDFTFLDILIGIKNTWFSVLDDLLQQKFELSTFTKQNNLFFIGLTLIIFGIIFYLYNFFTEDDTVEDSGRTIRIEHHYTGLNPTGLNPTQPIDGLDLIQPTDGLDGLNGLDGSDS